MHSFFSFRAEIVHTSSALISKLSAHIYALRKFAVLQVEEILEKLII